MKKTSSRVLIPLLFCLLASCSVDKDYDLSEKNIDYEINAGSQVAVPIGSFTTLRINNLLSEHARQYFTKDDDSNFVYDPMGQVLTDFELGHYELHGLEFINLGDFGIPEIKFYIVFHNTLPFEFDLSSHVLDTLGNQIPDVVSILDNVTLPPGTAETPSAADGILVISPKQTQSGLGFDGFDIVLKVKSMPTSSMFIDKHLGLALKNVRVQLPKGINFRIKKNQQ